MTIATTTGETWTDRSVNFTDRFGHRWTLPLVREGSSPTVMVIGSPIAPQLVVFGAESFESAHEKALESICDRWPSFFPTIDDESDADDADEYIDGHGHRCTLDATIWRTIGF